MAKQSMKQQIYQSIANSQVQEVMEQKRQQEIAQLQADYDAWTKQQQGIAALQAEYDAWLGAQTPTEAPVEQPVKQKTINEVKQLPTLEKPKSREETEAFRNEKIAKREAVLAQKNPKEKLMDNPFMSDYLSIKTQNDLGKAEDKKATSVDNWLDPNYKLSDTDKDAARQYAQAELAKFDYNSSKQPVLSTPEERQHYSDMVNLLNKTNGLTNAMTGVIKQPLNLAKTVRDVGRDVGNQLSGLGAAFTDKLGITEGATQRHNEKVDAANSFYRQNDESMQRAYENAKTQNPWATGGGEIAGQIGMYALTNPVFDSLGAAAGLGKAGSFALNQVGQNLQDVALDTLPTLNQYLDDNTLSDEEKKALLANIGINAAGNLVMGGVGLGIDALKARKAAKAIPGIEDVDNVVRNATKQAEDAAQNIDALAKQIPEVPVEEVTNPLEDAAKLTIEQAEEAADDIKLSDAEIQNLLSGMEPAENAAEAAAKAPKVELPAETNDQMAEDFMEIYHSMNSDYDTVAKLNNEKVTAAFDDLQAKLNDYEQAAFKAENIDEITTAKKAVNASRKRLERAVKAVDPEIKLESTKYRMGELVGKPEFRRTEILPPDEAEIDELVNDWIANENPNKWVRDAEPIETPKNVPGGNSLQTFGGPSDAEFKTSKLRTNSIEKLGWGDQMPEKDFAYRVYSEAEQRADAAARYADSKNVVSDLMNKNYEDFDELDVKTAYNEAQRLLDQGDKQSIAQAQRLMAKTAAVQRQSGRVVQASAEFTRNSAAGALGDAMKMEEDTIINPWKSQNKKAVAGNSRIAKALADMGNKVQSGKVRPELTHDQIKEGVIAELQREVGSVEKYFNDNDIEFLTTLAEDKSIPVWQITSEIEHKLNTGNWYSLDESLPIPKPTNTKLQSALNSLIEKEVRAEKAAPDLKQITEEVRNTLAKESADFDGQFTDDDIDYLANLINEGATKNEIADALNTKLATGSFGISDETMQQVNAIFKEISNFDPNSKQFVEGQLEAYRLLANEVVGDATPLEKFEAWRYLAMLGNPKTMIRNLVGNKMFGVVTGVSNNVAALAEAGIDKASKALGGEGIQRTKSILNPIKDMDLVKAAAEDADVSRYRQMIGSKYEKFSKDTLRQQKSVFNSKLLQLYEKATDAGISDYSAVKKKFSTSLAGYLKANGYDTSIFKAEDELRRLKNLSETQLLSDAEKNTMERLAKEVEALEKGRDYALKQAEYATFHEDNAFAKWLTETSQKAPGIGRAVIEGIVPFKKTPANVLKSGLEYSPVGFFDSLKKTLKFGYENTGKRAGNLADTYISSRGKEVQKTLANDVIESWSKSLTGTGLTALGFYLLDKGILQDSDPDTKYQDQLEGLQNYSIKIGDKTYTVDWAAPAVMPLLLGAEIAKVWNAEGNETEHWYENLDEYLNAANRMADPIVETSMLQGVKDTLETAANAAKYNENLNIPALAIYNAATGYLTQGIPTISGQIARTVDNTRRSTYTDKEGVAGTLEKQGRKMMNKIPGLSQLNQPYVDTYGREQANSPFGSALPNLAYQMISPGYLADINTTDADRMSREVYNAGKNESVLPKWQSYFKDENNKRVSPEDYTTAAKAYGQTNYEIREALANDEWFNGLSDSQKEEIVKGINTISEHVGKAAIDPEYSKDSKAYNAYKDGGIEGLLDYYKGEANKDTLKEISDGTVKADSKAGEKALSLIEQGKTEEAKQVVNDRDAFNEYGSDNASYAYSRYEATKQKIPGLTVDEYKTTVNKMDGLVDGKKNGQISQKEMLAYLNKGNYTQAEAEKLWRQYGNDWSYKVSKNKDGLWTAKKSK